MRGTDWYTLRAVSGRLEASATAWVQVSYSRGSSWGFLRADTSNSSFSRWFGPQSGTLKWTFGLLKGKEQNFMSIMLGGDDSVYVSNDHDSRQGDYLFVLNPDGTKKFDKYPEYEHHAIDAQGVVYCTDSNTDALIAMNPDGSEKWRKTVSYPTSVTVTRQVYVNRRGYVIVNDDLFLPGDSGGRFYILNRDGQPIGCEYGYFLNSVNGFALNCDDSIVLNEGGVITYYDNCLQRLWRTGGSYCLHLSTPITDDHCRIYSQFTQYENNGYKHGLMALDHLGQELWRLYFQDFYPDSALDKPFSSWNDAMAGGFNRSKTEARSDTTIYNLLILERNGQWSPWLAAIHMEGWVRWFIPLEIIYSIGKSEIVVDRADRTYVSTLDHLLSINSDGTVRWVRHFPGEEFQALTLSRDGTLYVAGKNKIYAFGD